MACSVVIAGAGISGCTAARVLAEAGLNVVVQEKRAYVGGNCADTYDSHAQLVHRFGPHAFHTNDEEVWAFLGRFAEWREYAHRVVAPAGKDFIPLPLNLDSIAKYARPDAAKRAQRASYTVRELLADADPELCKLGQWAWDNFYAGYSQKQWGVKPDDLPAWIMDRVPVRFSDDDRYHQDKYQAMPELGYSAMLERILKHPRIEVRLKAPVSLNATHLIYTGSLDELYEYRHGKLPYRYLRFEYEHHKDGPKQPVAQINYSDERIKYTRTIEYRHMTDGKKRWKGATTICREFPCDTGEFPCYPVEAGQDLAYKYALLAQKDGVWALGRLALYKYLNMDQAVRRAIDIARKYLGGGSGKL